MKKREKGEREITFWAVGRSRVQVSAALSHSFAPHAVSVGRRGAALLGAWNGMDPSSSVQ